MKFLKQNISAALIWLFALVFLFFMDPSKQSPSFCLFKLIGFQSCWGCGIGHAIHYALHLQWKQAFAEHVLGIPAAVGILYQVFSSFYPQKQQTTFDGPTTNAYDDPRPAAR